MPAGSGKPQTLKVLSQREAEVFAALADSYCAPGGAFPAVADSDAVVFIDDLAARSPRRNRVGFRLLLAFADLLPLLRGYRAPLRRLDRSRRDAFLRGLDKSRWAALAIPGKLLKTLTMMSYYGCDEALRAAGYDPDAIVARGGELRAQWARQ